ncbi:hypothetical protein TwortDSMZ_084 [Staphylococcus phage Twort]|uniref:Uncharacterized protein n=2 Tax=Staphylococcus phage Twort (strain DSM 17442 / HER 48) TaxID=2908167 RepID=A0A6H0X578_BPTWO|nr:terminase small subunit [Staphylococcus phage Twort]AAX92386.1 ORF092 [Staphylococcus phage Twort]QIW89084.1 hypothetical protein TwortDSMZ_084 [Staphylococcus phage Twort]
MSRAGRLRRRMEKKKVEQEDKSKYIQDGFMNSIQTLMFDFQNKVNAGQVEIKDPNDLYKLFVIYSQMQQLVGDQTEGGGVLPQLSGKQQKVFDEIITENSEDGEIDMKKLSELSEDDITNMIADKEKAMNNDNSETF